MRRSLAWALTLPLVLLGTEAAHALAYEVVYPQAHARILLETGHGYLTWLPLALAAFRDGQPAAIHDAPVLLAGVR